MGSPGVEPGTSRLSGVRSNRLSYKPTGGLGEERRFRLSCQNAVLIIHLKKGFVKLIF